MREAQRKYERSEKGKATQRRYNLSIKNKIRQSEYKLRKLESEWKERYGTAEGED